MYLADPEARQHNRQNVGEQLGPATSAVLDPLQFFVQRAGLGRVFLPGELADGGFEITEQGWRRRLVLAMEGRQLVENVVSPLQTRMVKDLTAGHHLEGDAAEAHADFDTGMSRVLAGGPPVVGQDVKVVVAAD